VSGPGGVSEPGTVNVSSRERVGTERLICERLRLEHAPELTRLLGDPRVARTVFADGLPLAEPAVLEGIRDKIAHWERHGFGPWLLRDRSTGEMVGRGGLQHTFVAGADEVEAGWAIIPQRWGQGLATELALASVALAFDDLRLEQIVAYTLPDNAASRRVMQKAGFAYEAEIVHKGLDHVLYRRARP
jgi:ribosomal-protein-alanine N-acetyltransferase